MIKCSCLCGKIEFEAEEVPGLVFNCHCSRCRRSHGAAFSTQVIAHKESLKILKGKELMTEYKSPSAIRAFCARCGARLMNYDNGSESYLSISAAAVNSSMPLKPIGECFVNEKFGFVALNAAIPHYETLPQGKLLYR